MVQEQVDADGDRQIEQTTAYRYDEAGRVAEEVTSFEGEILWMVGHEYDDEGRRSRSVTVDPSTGHEVATTAYSYDEADRLVREAHLLFGEEDDEPVMVDYAYDASGLLARRVDRGQGTAAEWSRYERDAEGNVRTELRGPSKTEVYGRVDYDYSCWHRGEDD